MWCHSLNYFLKQMGSVSFSKSLKSIISKTKYVVDYFQLLNKAHLVY